MKIYILLILATSFSFGLIFPPQNAAQISFDKIVFGTDYSLYAANEYLKILKNHLNLSDAEIKRMLNK